jgi:Fatty acid cis/trans isomerase (CTI)
MASNRPASSFATTRPSTGRRCSRLGLSIAVLLGCSAYREHQLDRRYGEDAVRDREIAATERGAIDYVTQVRPILETRCAVCHGCFDASCQLDLGSPEGIDRGTSKQRVYEATRLLEIEPTRLFEDEQTTAAWRKHHFAPVLNEHGSSVRANREASVLLRSLELKRAHPVRPGGQLAKDIDLSLHRDQQCPNEAEFGRFARKHPQWGMPFGLPGLDDREHEIVTRWITEGATHTPPPALGQRLQTEVEQWERFLNDDAPKARLASRYIYEHLFLAHLHFGGGEEAPQYFELVRSKTPPGQPIARISTRRPYDDPGIARPWYRLQPVHESIVAKLHLPYRLDDARRERWKKWFIDADYQVDTLPGYEPKLAANPFATFAAIPPRSRYRFMLDEAQFTLMGFIKGPVCRGPGAINVIDEQFWVYFVDPELDTAMNDSEFLRRNADALALPAQASSNARPLATWMHQSENEQRWAAAKQQALREESKERPATLELLWDGDGDNRNAVLTVFRHFDSAAVVKGMVGDGPKTAWVIDYPVFERIHYLLVAGFDVYGNVGHQLATRTYMDFLRMESELNFLQLLPEPERERLRAFWYRDTHERAYHGIIEHLTKTGVASGLRYTTDDPKHELYGLLGKHFAKVREHRYDLDRAPEGIATTLREIVAVRGERLHHAPEAALLLIPDAPAGFQIVSIIRNDGHTNIASPFFEESRRVPKEDGLTVAVGFVGTYPNAFWVVERAQLGEFVRRFGAIHSEADYAAMQRDFGVRRTDPDFWQTSDRIAEIFRRDAPIEWGLLDLARYERPAKP